MQDCAALASSVGKVLLYCAAAGQAEVWGAGPQAEGFGREAGEGGGGPSNCGGAEGEAREPEARAGADTCAATQGVFRNVFVCDVFVFSVNLSGV